MKLKFLIAVTAFLSIVSCSSDDTIQNPEENPSTDYFPLATGNYWVYNVDGEMISERDSLYVSHDTLINAKTYKKFKTLNLPFGFFSGSLNDNAVRIEGNSVLISGNSGFDLGGEIPVDLNLNDFVIFKENAAVNEELSSVSGIIEQDFNGFPLKLEYTMKSTAIESLPTFTTTDGFAHSDLKGVKIALNLKISATITIPEFPIPFTFVILNPQDVLVSKQYYENNIGMIYSTTTLSYELADLSEAGIELPIPASDSQTQEEHLNNYFVNP